MTTGGESVDGAEVRDVEVGEGTIRLAQLLKLADLVEAGGDARALVASGGVLVDGEVETRRGRQLRVGDVVAVPGAVHPLGTTVRLVPRG